LSPGAIRERAHYLLRQVLLFDHRARIAGIFSGGMKQRLSLAASLMSNPKILFMDEPTTGLDPQTRLAIRELTKEFNEKGMTIIYTTHDMDEAEKICDRIVIMDKGKIIGNGTSEELKQRVIKGYHLEVEVESAPSGIAKDLRKLPSVSDVTIMGDVIHITVDRKDAMFNRVNHLLHQKKVNVQEIRYKEPTLEEVFISLTKKELRD
jgi:ABC-2 type transport system ATP-binding protein